MPAPQPETTKGRADAFRAEVRAFLEGALTEDIKAAAARQAGVFAEGGLSRIWHRKLYERGWVAPSWPREYGGPGWTPVERFVFDDECARAGAPQIPVMGLQMCGPVIIKYGSDEQKNFFLPRMLSGEHYWCQGYSEPGAGSDLASLQCRAVRDGDDYVINGSKIWTTHAQYANWMFLLVRTSNEGKPQAGISFLLTRMDTQGLAVRPIISMSGEHEVNQVFFDNVRVPVSQRLGEENQGWTVAKALLEFERGAGAGASRLKRMIDFARAIAREEHGGHGASLWDENADFRSRLAQISVEVDGLAYAEGQAAQRLSVGKEIGATASVLKMMVSTLQQRATELQLEALGHYAIADQRGAMGYGANVSTIGPEYAATPTATYLNTRAATIYGGSNEVQHNILARALLDSRIGA